MRRDYKTYYAKPSEIERNWVILDAEGEILGRLAAKAASIIRGKNKPSYTPSMDTGDFVVVINAEKIRVTGKKEEQKKYYRHSGYPGGLKEESYGALMKRSPEKVIFEAVKGMLPKNKLGAAILKNCYIYAGTEHEQEAQKPTNLNLNDLK